MRFDSHSHTKFSADSDMSAQDALLAARKQGIGIVFTEHLDFEYPGELDFVFDPKTYWKEYEPLRGADLRLGIEVGLVPGKRAQTEAFIAEAPFDEVIGSIHLIDGNDIYDRKGYEGCSQDEIYRRYFELMENMVREHSYIDILGHIDYISRYAPYEDAEIRYERWSDAIDGVLRAVIETETVMEINTRRFGDPSALKELMKIYRRYHELGGRYVTVGSDAHHAEGIGAHFELAEAFAGELKLTPVTFAERKMQILENFSKRG